jgi:hypothetical protein
LTKNEQTWSVLILATLIALLALWLHKKKTAGATTQTSVTVQGQTTNFPSRNDNNEVLLRVCTYDSGSQLTLDPGAVGGHCPPVYTDISGKSGNLVKDEVITVPQAGQNTNQIIDYA